jgi:hypothetical protein
VIEHDIPSGLYVIEWPGGTVSFYFAPVGMTLFDLYDAATTVADPLTSTVTRYSQESFFDNNQFEILGSDQGQKVAWPEDFEDVMAERIATYDEEDDA